MQRSPAGAGRQRLLTLPRRPRPYSALPRGAAWCTRLQLLYSAGCLCAIVLLALALRRTPSDARELAAVPCNLAGRRVATCAHRGNAAELLQQQPRKQQGVTGAAGGNSSLVGQMQLLWQAGVSCFDYDVVALAGGELLVGHPADLAAGLTNPAALHSSSSSQALRRRPQPSAGVSPDALHTHTLQQLRGAGLSAAAAPTLAAVLAAFAQLLAQQHAQAPGGGRLSTTAAAAAAAARAWRGVPVVNLEVKGAAAMSQQAWRQVADAAAAAGVGAHVILWLRQMPPPFASGHSTVATQLAADLRTALSRSSSSSSSSSNSSSQQRPLLGLIVPDRLLTQPQLAAVAAQRDAFATASALLAVAGGLAGQQGAAAAPANASSLASHGPAVLEAFDVLAPSIKLPAAVLELLLRSKPCAAWTLESARHYKKALWLGLDVGITNTPLAQEAALKQQQDAVCGRPP